jgi:hypothetical protein
VSALPKEASVAPALPLGTPNNLKAEKKLLKANPFLGIAETSLSFEKFTNEHPHYRDDSYYVWNRVYVCEVS